jgi:hypothetical protein
VNKYCQRVFPYSARDIILERCEEEPAAVRDVIIERDSANGLGGHSELSAAWLRHVFRDLVVREQGAKGVIEYLGLGDIGVVDAPRCQWDVLWTARIVSTS